MTKNLTLMCLIPEHHKGHSNQMCAVLVSYHLHQYKTYKFTIYNKNSFILMM